jgi:hypothetical protein
VGSSSVWAAEKTITLDYSSFGLTTSYNKKTATVDGFGFTVDQGYKGSNNVIQMNSNKGSGILYNTSAISGLKSITVNVASGEKTYTITTGKSEKPTANSQTGTSTGTYNSVSGDTYFQLKVSGASYFSSIVIKYEDTGGTPAPSITAENVSIAYNSTSGSITSTISNPVSGGVLSAEITAGNEGSWLTLGAISGSTAPLTCSANETKTERTATVTLTYTYNTDKTVTKNVTVTQDGNPNVFDNISDITKASTAYSVRGTVVAISSKGFVIGDGTGYAYTYLNAAPEVIIGDKVSVSGKTATYGHILQFTNTATIDDSETSSYNNTPAVKVVDATAIAGYNTDYQLSDYVQFEGVLAKNSSNYVITVGTTSARISYPTEAQKTALDELLNKKVRVKGYFTGFSGSGTSATFTAMLESIEEVKVPTITVTPTSLAVFIYEVNNGPSEAQTFTVSGANLTGDITVSLDESSNFEISSDDATYGSSLTLSSSATNSTLFVRLKAGLAISDDYSGKITLTSAGAEEVEVTLAGSVVGKPSLSFDLTDTAWEFPTENYVQTETSYTNSGYTITLGASSNGGHKVLTDATDGHIISLIWGKTDATLALPAFDFNVNKIIVYGNSGASGKVTFNIFDGNDAVSSKVTQLFKIAEGHQSAGTIYTLKVTNNNNCQISKIEIFGDAVSVTIPESKYTTFASTNDIDFNETGVTAYTAKVEGNVAKLSQISGNVVPANTGVILYAEAAGNYVGTITEGDPTGAPVSVNEDNEMVGVTAETTVSWTAGSKYNYILQGGVFKKASETGAKLHAGKAYLSTTNPPASRELQIVFEDEATGIADVRSQKEEGGFFSLSGQRVTKPTKGLYIKNGKKMIVK